jgi:chromosome segregation ATPase
MSSDKNYLEEAMKDVAFLARDIRSAAEEKIKALKSQLENANIRGNAFEAIASNNSSRVDKVREANDRLSGRIHDKNARIEGLEKQVKLLDEANHKVSMQDKFIAELKRINRRLLADAEKAASPKTKKHKKD